MKKMTISSRLWTGFSGVLLLSALIGFVAIWQVNSISRNLTTVNDVNSVKQRYAINFRGSVHDRAIDVRDVVLVTSAGELQAAVTDIERLTAKYAESAAPLDEMMRESGTSEQERAILASIKETEARTLPMVAEIVALQKAGDAAGAKRMLMERARPAFVEWLARINQFIDLQEARNKVIGTETRSMADQFKWLIVGLCAAGLALGGALAYWATRSMTHLGRLTGIMQGMARGELAEAVPLQDRSDEIGRIAGALEVLRLGGLDNLRLRDEAQEFQADLDARLKERDRDFGLRSREQQVVVAALATGLTKLASGNLTFRLSEPFPEEYKKLQEDFNGAMGTLQDTMKMIGGATEGIRSGTGEVSQAADDLSKRTEQQAASLEETAAALDEITATVRKTAEGANHARDVVTNAKADAERSGEVVSGAVQAMAQIEGSAKQISSIIGVIDEIAFQTNLLALNAGVEAARAGEAGKGFAVVASEVRALAQRSAEAAKEIKTLIQASSTQVESGVDLVGEAGKALERIVVQVAEINAIVAEIAASAKEQATGLAEVNTAINQMDQVTQQNAAMVEQSTAASHTLAREAEELGSLVSRFEVGQIASATATPNKRPGLAKRTVTALKSVGGRGMSAARMPAHAEESWEEF